MENKNLLYIISLIGVFVFMHYSLSIDAIGIYLNEFNLNFTSILSWDDIHFAIAFINKQVLLTTAIVFFGYILFFAPIIKKSNVSSFKEGIQKACNYIAIQPNKKKYLIKSILLIILMAIITLAYTIKNSNIPFLIIIALLSIFIYYKYGKLDIIILSIIYIITTVCYKDVFGKHETVYSSDIKLELASGKTVQSDSIHKVIFIGSKYVIIQSDSLSVKLYPTSEIKEIEWINKR